MTRRRRRDGVERTRRGEDGAVLFFALLFLSVVSLISIALLDATSTNLGAVAAFRTGSAEQSATSTATEIALSHVRYDPATYCPVGANDVALSSVTVPGASGESPVTIDVWCSLPASGFTPYSVATRTSTLSACPATFVSAGTCSSTNPYLTVQVTFDDYAPASPVTLTTLCSSTCGSSMTIDEWGFRSASV